ncbi:MAG: hypothetical protein ACM3O9_03790 [Methylocystaceae bacterium]
MSKLALLFLLIGICYLAVKSVLFLILYIVSLRVEKTALHKKKLLHRMLMKKRREDHSRHRKAYDWYDTQKERAHMEAL